MHVSKAPAIKAPKGFTASGRISEAIPRIKAMLKIQLPYALPSETPECFETPDITLTQSSGALVPNPIITIPIMNGDILKTLAITEAPATNASLDHANKTKPKTTKTTESRNGIFPYINQPQFN
jgi:hypothetical protein